MYPDGTTFMLFDPVLTELQGKQLWSQQLVRSWLSQQPLSGRTFVVERHRNDVQRQKSCWTGVAD